MQVELVIETVAHRVAEIGVRGGETARIGGARLGHKHGKERKYSKPYVGAR